MTFWEIIADETFAFWDTHMSSFYSSNLKILKRQLAIRFAMLGE